MRNFFKLKLVVATFLMVSSVIHADFVNISGNSSVYNQYLMGVIGASSSTLAATVTGSQNSSFEEFENFCYPNTVILI